MTFNPSQQRAVDLDSPQIVVMSGPGSGKTRVAVERVRRLHGKTVVLTFTNAAAHEFRSRVMPLPFGTVGPTTSIGVAMGIHDVRAEQPVEFVGTLHSYCFKIIREFGHLIGYGKHNVSLLPEADSVALLKGVREQLGYKVNDGEEKVREVLKEYHFTLKRNNLVDYDGILTNGLELLGKEEVRAARLCDNLIVEEAQDSAEIDWAIYRAIPAANRFFIGDVDQAIFEFREAYPKGLLDLARSEGTKVLKLEQNYRCAKAICAAANRLIRHNESRFEKDTVSATGEEGSVEVTGFEDAWEELSNMTRYISGFCVGNAGVSAAILCRTNFEVHRVRDFIRAATTNFELYMADERNPKPPDWRRALLLLGLAASPYNEVLAEQYLLLDHIGGTVKGWKLEAQTTGHYLSDRIPRQTATGLLQHLAVCGVGYETVSLIESRMMLLPEDAQVTDLLQDLYSNEGFARKQPEGTVFLGTIHSAKGREFDAVFLPAFEETHLNRENIEEERRLAFVALTRARNLVRISWAERRQPKWGGITECRPSEFIEEMGL